MSMLFMTVATTSDGMLAGVVDGSLRLDYPRAGWFDFKRVARFKSFCSANALGLKREHWGKEVIYRTNLGQDPVAAANHIGRAFQHVYGQSGPYKLHLNGYGWQPSN